MSTQQAKTSDDLKRQVRRFWIMSFAFPVAIPIALMLTYYGYCFGWWGRNSLLLQHLFQCKCPVGSEQARYPDEVVVIISACPQATVRLSPSGRLLHVHEENLGITTVYLLDLPTMERIQVTAQPFSSFITDDLLFVGSNLGIQNYIIDRITGAQYPIQKFVYSRPDAEINGETNLAMLAESLRQAEDVFLVGVSTDTAVALTSDFRTHPERSFTANRFDLPDFNMERFLRENNIVYQTILPDYPHKVLAPDGRLIAWDDGIYVVATNQLIVQAPPSLVMGWTSDGRSAIYSSPFGLCLIRRGMPFGDGSGCATWVPQPVLLLKVPEEYLSSTATP